MPLPRRPAAVIFDMDGLLFNTETLSFESAVTAAAHFGHTVDWELFRTLIGRQWPDIRTRLMSGLGNTFDAEAFRPVWISHYETLLKLRLDIKPGVIEILDLLDRLEIPRAIATSSPRDKVDFKIGTFDITRRFHAIVAQGDYPKGKPEPDPFLMAADRLGVDPAACLALEDSHNGIRSAHAAGMMAVMVPDLLDPTDEIRPFCTAVAHDLHEVALMIEKARAA
ncbi:HAD superfamily hydrolase (TIGR01509 family) [Rhizobium aquaticum]|uniref:HAD superfamily hydrolase (TIGR01509 family) n=1 Tax=Rhizobium aquaticum TaxID=1549636 RepID=A0ABV2J3L7_9HYPH